MRYATRGEDKVDMSDGGKISFPDPAGAPARHKERLSLTRKMNLWKRRPLSVIVHPTRELERTHEDAPFMRS